MSVHVDIGENRNVRLTDERIECRPPNRIAFAAEGVITVTSELLGEFEGTSLKPVRVDISVDESRTVRTDLEEEASLRLETVDVGVETPDTDDLSPGMDTVSASSGDSTESTDASPGAIAFSVEGAIIDVPTETFDPITDGSPSLESIVFAVDDSVRTDGGSDDAIFSLGLLGRRIVIYRNGVIDVGTGENGVNVDIL
ncbi:hypothetical protein [Natronosalvus rutilus]|uniref:Uncharacterized protein n=1 Tax=Natronosalvus rutilus TaxID=2953753 RepID=A0A9E7N6E7_9EURY|nr:hypothetical protein [Natronosalvus rutilus]UTF52574.1 hypothetical protein NGM29_12345 [Natronosalvus rutilus]